MRFFHSLPGTPLAEGLLTVKASVVLLEYDSLPIVKVNEDDGRFRYPGYEPPAVRYLQQSLACQALVIGVQFHAISKDDTESRSLGLLAPVNLAIAFHTIW